jgi:leader peptidase (prepilin peptidase)/N-methyltransferase
MNTDWRNLMMPAAWILHGGAFVLGACIGSFLNVVIWRVPRGESLVSPPSHCPKCDHAIRPWENIPILSWLCLRGRCSECRNPISLRYPSVELLTALVFLGLWLRVWQGAYPLTTALSLATVAAVTIVGAFTDFDLRIIPNKATYTGMIIAVILAVVMPSGRMLDRETAGAGIAESRVLIAPLVESLIDAQGYPRLAAVLDVAVSAGLAALILIAIRELGRLCFGRNLKKMAPESPPDALGLGDVKLLVAIAALMGFEPFVFVLLLASLAGFAFGFARIVCRPSRSPLIPFGPYIAFGSIVWMVAGSWIQSLFESFPH